ncbi:MAG TPA: glycosyltransferase family 2 protein [Chloroflexaceae bacterium]|nr:glycosyltransferase family 2 protein [Chloroflexaceae bacterium]
MSVRPSLAVVIVSWNVRDLLRRCLLAVEASLAGAGVAHELLVVDNASADGTPAMLCAEFPRVRLLEPGANLGFAGGNNLALRAVLAEGRARYALLLNPDTEPIGDAIPRLVRELEARPELAAVGPLLRYGDGSPQPSRRRFPTLATLFWESTALDRLWPGNPWAARYRLADRPDDAAQPVDWLVGAALLVRVEAIGRAGLLDERFFMYSEELEWQARLQRASGGAAIWFQPAAVVVHHEGRSSEQAVARRHLSFSRSKLLLARMWYGWGAARLLRAFLRLGFACELAAEGLKLALRHRSALRRERIAVYWRVLREL